MKCSKSGQLFTVQHAVYASLCLEINPNELNRNACRIAAFKSCAQFIYLFGKFLSHLSRELRIKGSRISRLQIEK